MPVDPQIQTLLDKGTGVPATHTLPVPVARSQYEVGIALMGEIATDEHAACRSVVSAEKQPSLP